MADDPIRDLLSRQSGVLSRALLLEHVAEHEVRRRLRRRELVVLHPGVYVDHTGEPTWVQRAWAGVLALWPAALCHESALRADDGPGRSPGEQVLHVAVDRHRSPAPPPGVRLHRLADLESRVRWNLSPPRVRIEHAVLDVAAATGGDLGAIAVLADAVQSRRTTTARLVEALAGRQRIARRAFLADVLADVGAGTCSVLEHGYLTRVERAHGLPSAQRPVRESVCGPVFRDVSYDEHGVVVELDGRLFHDTTRLARATETSTGTSTSSSAGGRRHGWAGARSSTDPARRP